MSGGSTTLYTPAILSLAVELAQYPLTEDIACRGDGRSKLCGSTITVGVALDGQNQIDRVGARVSACAIGQAAAALFLRSASGRTADEITSAEVAINLWLKGEGPMPDWPDLDILASAQAYPSRHGAILLPWSAARSALFKPAIAD